MYKIMMCVGEASGDLHGASVAAALRRRQGDICIFGMGGEQMRRAGVDIRYDIADLGVIGIVEVVRNLRRLFRLRDELAAIMDAEQPDVLVVIDYPGFNMRLAEVAKNKGIPVVYYISPSAWAWGRGRARTVARTAARVAAIFPFEAEVYRQAGAAVTFVGHPLLDIVKPSLTPAEAYRFFHADPARPLVLLMPGSRQQEINNLLPAMLDAAARLAAADQSLQFYLPLASTISAAAIDAVLARQTVPVTITREMTYDLMHIASAAVAASGTATLELALLGVPTVIVYKVAALTGLLGKMLLKLPHIGLPNIVAGRQVLPELLQGAVTGGGIAAALQPFLYDQAVRARCAADLAEVRRRLGEGGAVDRVAQVVLEVAAQGRREEA